MENCLFCELAKNKNIFETNNFYILIGKGIRTAGHCMIVPKQHLKCLAEMDDFLYSEYFELKNKLINLLETELYKPFIIEHGVFGQSVFHAHSHFIPSKAEEFEETNIIKDMVYPAINKWNFEYKEINNFNELQKFYKNNKEYLYFEQNNKIIAVKTSGYNIKEVKYDIIYRQFFLQKGLTGIGSWQTMSEEDKIIDNIKVEKTRKILMKLR